MSYATEYSKVITKSRQHYYQGLKPDAVNRLYDEYVEIIGRLAAQIGQPGGITPERAEALEVQIRNAMRSLAERHRNILEARIPQVMRDQADYHKEAVLAAGRSIRYTVDPRFAAVPERAVELMMVRRGLGLSENFSSLIDRGLRRTVPEVDGMLSYAVATGMSSQRLSNHLAAAIGREDPLLAAAVRRSTSASGAIMRRALAEQLATPQEMKAARKLFYESRRIAVSEMNTAYFEADREASDQSNVVDLVRFTVSGRHAGLPSSPDVCDLAAEADMHGFGPGLYHPAAAPSPLHPHCGCHLRHVLRPPSEWRNPKKPLPTGIQDLSGREAMRIMQRNRNAYSRDMTPDAMRRDLALLKERTALGLKYAHGRAGATPPVPPVPPKPPAPQPQPASAPRTRREAAPALTADQARTEVLQRNTSFTQRINSIQTNVAVMDGDMLLLRNQANNTTSSMVGLVGDERQAKVAEVLRLNALVKELADKKAALMRELDTLNKTRLETVREPLLQKAKAKPRVSLMGVRTQEEKERLRTAASMFSQFVGSGKAIDGKPIRLKVAWINRSYYRPGSGQVNLSPKVGDNVVIHEMAHWLEDVDLSIRSKVYAFLERRTAGEVAQPLSKLTGISGYRPTETAKPDDFINAYMGAEYRTSSGDRYGSEILSMGLEMFYKDPVTLAEKDPEYFDFIYNLLRGL